MIANGDLRGIKKRRNFYAKKRKHRQNTADLVY
jgi:hypothetical protein